MMYRCSKCGRVLQTRASEAQGETLWEFGEHDVLVEPCACVTEDWEKTKEARDWAVWRTLAETRQVA